MKKIRVAFLVVDDRFDRPLLSQVISKFFESYFAPLSELEVQQKRKLMVNRFLQLFLFTSFFAFVCAVFVLFLTTPLLLGVLRARFYGPMRQPTQWLFG